MTDIHSWVGAYVVDAIEPEEHAQFEDHLLGCESCRREVGEFRESLATMADAVATAPPPDLRASVLAGISGVPNTATPGIDQQSSPAVRHGESGATVTPIGRRRSSARLAWLVAAAAMVASILLGTGVVVQQQQHQSQLERTQASERDLTLLLAADDVRVHRTQLSDGSPLTYVVSGELGKGVLVASGLPAPKQGRAWQIWTMHDGTPKSAGLVGSGGRTQVWIEGIPGAQAIAVTDEPASGSEQPTTTPQALAKL
ncbi:anti-sigma factor [Aestuariimicrobium kwangyangense]|uniref:anti-sigma factor n=1 Tax=Aestuariimicrobium kwangyangense TaxID=396389 RepID=UPI0003B4670B|nr:anti-sigma factor [Aestuariimicrobium kwangyangense]